MCFNWVKIASVFQNRSRFQKTKRPLAALLSQDVHNNGGVSQQSTLRGWLCCLLFRYPSPIPSPSLFRVTLGARKKNNKKNQKKNPGHSAKSEGGSTPSTLRSQNGLTVGIVREPVRETGSHANRLGRRLSSPSHC